MYINCSYARSDWLVSYFQVPKNMEESELREMFCKFGDIHQLNVLRDKISGAHRGRKTPKYQCNGSSITSKIILIKNNSKLINGIAAIVF